MTEVGAAHAEPAEAATTTEELLPGGFHRFVPVLGAEDNPETNKVRPLTDAVLTVRVIKSFPYRTMKALVLSGIDLTKTSVGELKQKCRDEITKPGNAAWKAYRSYATQLDTLKLYTRAHGSKTTNLIINLDHEDWILSDEGKLLVDVGCENETEISFFNDKAYRAFLADPETKW